MHSGGEFQTPSKKHKHHQHPLIETRKKPGQTCNHVQNLSKKVPLAVTPNVAVIQKYENNLADFYGKKIGNLGNQIRNTNKTIKSASPITQTNPLSLQKASVGNSNIVVKSCGHVSKRKPSPSRNVVQNNIATPKPNTNFVPNSVIMQNINFVSQRYMEPSPNKISKNEENNEANKKSAQSRRSASPENVGTLKPAQVLPKNNTPEANKKCVHANKNADNLNKTLNHPEEQKNQNLPNSSNVENIQFIPAPKSQGTEVHQICTVAHKTVDNKKRSRSPVPNPATPKQSKQNNQITEIYKRSEDLDKTHDSTGDLTSVTLAEPKTENLSFKQVTEDLTNIIKNLQKQIQEVPVTKAKMEEIPSAMIKPKNKEFFKEATQQKAKGPTPKSAPPANNAGNRNVKNNNKNNNNKMRGSNSSLRSGSGSRSIVSTNVASKVMSQQISPRRFSSSTSHALSLQSSSSSNKRITRRMSTFNVDPLKALKDDVYRAIRNHKTFTIRGTFAPIRKALLARGWVEKFHISYYNHLSPEMKRYYNYTVAELLPYIHKDGLSELCKHFIKSKLLGGYQVDFYWGTMCDEAFRDNPDKIKLTIINKLKREIFSYTNKQGLCEASKFSYWYQKPNVSKLNHPRSYSLAPKNGEVKEFIADFHITAAMALFKWIVTTNVTKECKLISPTGKIPLEAFDFALNECCKFIKKANHEDIDTPIVEAREHEWNKFLEFFYKIVHYSNHFTENKQETEESLVRKSNYILNSLSEIWPYLHMDGMMNIWILKPSASCRGQGIHMCRTLQYALKVIRQNSNRRYIIQKYIERPLLIHNTKFDIRQWFLISNCRPLTIWMYKQCYLRFSSQTYNLRKLHESIHLTNNSVQCKYKNTSIDAALPSYNMWDSNEFQNYLANIGYPNAFKETVYPAMKQCITAAVLMHQDKMVIRKNCFELYGADFILTEDFQPWLLEINSSPALHYTTPVTARLCPKVLEDVIKVVIDNAHNVKAATGDFELIYKEQMSKVSSSIVLELKGAPLKNNYFYHSPEEELKSSFSAPPSYRKPMLIEQKQECLKTFSEEIKRTLKNLLQIIHNEKRKRQIKSQKVECDSCPPCQVGEQI